MTSPILLEPGNVVNDSAVVVGTFKPGSEPWHEARRSGLGGSEISAVVGLNKWDSRFTVHWRKKGQLSQLEETPPMAWGTRLEQPIYEEYEQNHLKPGLKMTTGYTFHHITRLWQIANPDGMIWRFIEGQWVLVDALEIKNVSNFSEGWGKDGSDIIPIYYRCQLAWYCDVLGLTSMKLRALFGGNDPRTYQVSPTLEDIEYLRSEGEQFMVDFNNDVLPNLDGHTATYDGHRELHPLITPKSVTQIEPELADRWWKVRDDLAKAEVEETRVKVELLDIMQNTWKASCGQQAIAYRQRNSKKEGSIPYLKSAPNPAFKTNIKEEALKLLVPA